MKKVKLVKMHLKNFKGIRDFTLEPNISGNTYVYGDNGVGKTTLRNAYLWCLTGRDSENRVDHEIRPLDKEGNVIHNLESIVDITLSVNGVNKHITRLYKERWSRKTGDVEKTYDGNTTEYYIDSVKVKKSEYEMFVGDIFNVDLIQLLSDPYYFISLDWRVQRDYLFSLINLTDKEVEESNPKLKGFCEKFNTSMLESEKKNLNAKKRKIAESVQENNSKLDENINTQIERLDWDSIKKEKSNLEKELKEVEELIDDKNKAIRLVQVKAQEELMSSLNKVNEQIRSKSINLGELIDKEENIHNKELKVLKSQLKDLESKKDLILDENRRKEKEKEYYKSEIEKLNKRREGLLNDYKNINKEKFSIDAICPTCGSIRKDIESRREELEKEFNLNKASRLNDNVLAGKGIAKEIENLTESLNSVSIESVDKLDRTILSLKDKIAKYPDYIASDKAIKLQEEINKLKEEAKRLGSQDIKTENIDNSELYNRKSLLEDRIKEQDRDLYKEEVYLDKEKRINELKVLIKESNIELARLDGDIFLLELFEKTKNELYESLINSKFEVVEFSLFEYLVDGTPKPNCKALFNGVPVSTLNTGAKVNVGLDVIRTFSNHFSQSYPVFVDNKESVTKTVDIDSQVIFLEVKQNQNKLLVK